MYIVHYKKKLFERETQKLSNRFYLLLGNQMANGNRSPSELKVSLNPDETMMAKKLPFIEEVIFLFSPPWHL